MIVNIVNFFCVFFLSLRHVVIRICRRVNYIWIVESIFVFIPFDSNNWRKYHLKYNRYLVRKKVSISQEMVLKIIENCNKVINTLLPAKFKNTLTCYSHYQRGLYFKKFYNTKGVIGNRNNRGKTDNTIVKRKTDETTNNDLQNITQKYKPCSDL
jgi:hypothetical protein